jgi:hypothetical protein
VEAEVNSDGFTITVQPAASAGAIFQLSFAALGETIRHFAPQPS